MSEQKGIDTLAMEFSKVKDELTVLRDDLKQMPNPTQTDYFYGLAPGVTTTLVNFPNGNLDIEVAGSPGHNTSIQQGNIANPDDVDIINEQSQQVFRNCIDKYSHNVNFIAS